MTEILVNHLWQSTLFVCAAAIVTLPFRKDGANIRFLIWLTASVKFLIPFSLLAFIGRHLRWEAAPTAHAAAEWSTIVDQIAQPGTMITGRIAAARLATTSVHWHWSVAASIFAIWMIGFVALTCYRSFQWLKLRSIVKLSTPLDIPAPLPVREIATALEPGIFGIFSPVLLLPAGVVMHLAADQLDSVVAHELSHWRRKDNFTATIQMLVEALFWFHPLVWWLGGRMVIERERACDEAVVQSGRARETYAAGILKVCQLYVQLPLPCTAGVSGGSLRRRIEEIMTNQVAGNIHFGKKCLLSVTGLIAIFGPFVVGFISAPYNVAMAQEVVGTGSHVDMKHYVSSEWKFSLDIPKRWNAFPADPTNSPSEVIRFESKEDGSHNLIIFRLPYDPKMTPQQQVAQTEQVLAKNGFSNFVTGATTIGSKRVLTLDFDRSEPDGHIWSCRHYFIVDGTLSYILGFGTTARDVMFNLYDRMAKSFVFEGSTG